MRKLKAIANGGHLEQQQQELQQQQQKKIQQQQKMHVHNYTFPLTFFVCLLGQDGPVKSASIVLESEIQDLHSFVLLILCFSSEFSSL